MCWAVVHTAMNLPVPYLMTGSGAVGYSKSTVLNGVYCFLYNCKIRPYYKIFELFCDTEHTHAQTDDAPSQLNRSFPTSQCRNEDRYFESVRGNGDITLKAF